MKFPRLFAVLALAALGSTAFAITMFTEIAPGPSIDWLKVSSERLPNGEIKFSVTIPTKLAKPHGTSLRSVRVTDHGQSSAPVRQLAPTEQNGDITKCVFSVTQKELENPDLCFSFALLFIRLRPLLPQ